MKMIAGIKESFASSRNTHRTEFSLDLSKNTDLMNSRYFMEWTGIFIILLAMMLCISLFVDGLPIIVKSICVLMIPCAISSWLAAYRYMRKIPDQ